MSRKTKQIKAMTRDEKLVYFCGGRVTVGKIKQVVSNSIKTSYVAKIRGVIVGNSGEYRHETPEGARAYGKQVMATWRGELTEQAGGESE